MKITVPNNCDNAPKRRTIRNFIISWFQKDWTTSNEYLEPKFAFKPIGSKTITDRESLKEYLEKSKQTSELTIEEVLSHGKFGACNGVIKSQKQVFAFAYFFEFKSAGKGSIKTISEYKIEIRVP